MVELGAYLHHRTKAGEEVPAHAEFSDAGTDISDRLVSFARGIIGPGQAHAVEDDDLQLVQLGLLAADLLEAHLLRNLGREDDRLLRLVLGCVLLVQSCEEICLAVVRPSGPDKGGRGWRSDLAWVRVITWSSVARRETYTRSTGPLYAGHHACLGSGRPIRRQARTLTCLRPRLCTERCTARRRTINGRLLSMMKPCLTFIRGPNSSHHIVRTVYVVDLLQVGDVD